MKRTTMLLTTGLLSATLAACGGASTTPTSQPATASGGPSNGSAVQAHNAADVTFAQSMIPHHRQAVQMAAMATSRAHSPAVKALAAQIQAAQDPEIMTMTGWLTSWGQPTQPAGVGGTTGHSMGSMPGMMSDADMTNLATLSGAAFDRAFLTMMTSHHRGAIDMATTEATQGQYQPGKDLARAIITGQSAELVRMKTLLTQV